MTGQTKSRGSGLLVPRYKRLDRKGLIVGNINAHEVVLISHQKLKYFDLFVEGLRSIDDANQPYTDKRISSAGFSFIRCSCTYRQQCHTEPELSQYHS
jgi:hypothetical protein